MTVNWLEVLGWKQEELEDLRFVGYAYIKQGHYDIAFKFFDALVILAKDNAYDLQTLGALYLQKGNNLMALDYLERALKLEPKHLPTLLNRTKALFFLGYKRQGALQARRLLQAEDPQIAGQANALLLAFA